jgi:hypothetical protein
MQQGYVGARAHACACGVAAAEPIRVRVECGGLRILLAARRQTWPLCAVATAQPQGLSIQRLT